jgi:hypothetical protein
MADAMNRRSSAQNQRWFMKTSVQQLAKNFVFYPLPL